MSAYWPFALWLAVPYFVANLIALASRSQKAGAALTIFSVLWVFWSLLTGLVFLLGLTVIVVVWGACRKPGVFPTRFLLVSTLATAAVILVVCTPRIFQFERLKTKYAFESMETRIPAPPAAMPIAANLKDVMADRLRQIEEDVERAGSWYRHGSRRSDALYRLHEETGQAFVRSAGFGVGRTIRVDPTDVESIDKPIIPISQPGRRDPSTGDWSDTSLVRTILADQSLDGLHTRSILDYASPRQFGYVKNRREVAGFRPHHFQERPEASGRFTLQTLDLVGMLMHETPVAYVSEHLPKMDELRDAPTRALDSFEELGLKQIQQGEDLYARESGNSIRLLGAIRATKQCTTCHACERGDLLGAFSYTLTRSNKD